MSKCTRFSPRASLAALGSFFRRTHLWDEVARHVHIRQKTLVHTPPDKLLDCLIGILAGARGVVEVNQRVRSSPALQRAFGRRACAEQSTLSQTLNRCSGENVLQLRLALALGFRAHSQAYRHVYSRRHQRLEVDIMGMPAGRQGEGVEKGHFSDQHYRRGRQLGRVQASLYDEIVSEQLYRGKIQLEKNLLELVDGAAEVLQLTPEERERTVVRVDGGGGTDANLNGLLERGYRVVAKVKNWQRSVKLCRSVSAWYPDPADPSRELGWIGTPHAYVRPTRQIGIRHHHPQKGWLYRVLVLPPDPAIWFELAERPYPDQPGELELLLAGMRAYDLRGGGVETANRNSQSGLGVCQRNKRSFAAQEMLVLLAQLAYNLLSWFRHVQAEGWPKLKRYGMQRLVRDWLSIDGTITIGEGDILRIVLNRDHPLAKPFRLACTSLLGNDLSIILREI